ncbi:MAG: hypothetical protein ACO3ZY_09855 [Phycisphaerales bacterium]
MSRSIARRSRDLLGDRLLGDVLDVAPLQPGVGERRADRVLERGAVEAAVRRNPTKPRAARGLLGERCQQRLDRDPALDEVARVERVGDRLGEEPLVEPSKRSLDRFGEAFDLRGESRRERAVVLAEAPAARREAHRVDDLRIEAPDRDRSAHGEASGEANGPEKSAQANAMTARIATEATISALDDREPEAGSASVTSIGPDQA